MLVTRGLAHEEDDVLLRRNCPLPGKVQRGSNNSARRTRKKHTQTHVARAVSSNQRYVFLDAGLIAAEWGTPSFFNSQDQVFRDIKFPSRL
jgi:hypothetical protein